MQKSFTIWLLIFGMSLMDLSDVFLLLQQKDSLSLHMFGITFQTPKESVLKRGISVFLFTVEYIFTYYAWMALYVGMISSVLINEISNEYRIHCKKYLSENNERVVGKVRHIVQPTLSSFLHIHVICKLLYMKYINVLLQALDNYKSVQSLVNGINSISSRFTIVLIVNAMAWFCYYFTFMTGDRKTSTSGRGWIARAEFGVYFALVVFCVIQAAEACNKVRPLFYTC